MSEAPRKRAALTGSAFDFGRMTIPCPKCDKEGLHDVIELVANDDARCPRCGQVFDLKDWKSRITHEAQELKKVKNLRAGQRP